MIAFSASSFAPVEPALLGLEDALPFQARYCEDLNSTGWIVLERNSQGQSDALGAARGVLGRDMFKARTGRSQNLPSSTRYQTHTP